MAKEHATVTVIVPSTAARHRHATPRRGRWWRNQPPSIPPPLFPHARIPRSRRAALSRRAWVLVLRPREGRSGDALRGAVRAVRPAGGWVPSASPSSCGGACGGRAEGPCGRRAARVPLPRPLAPRGLQGEGEGEGGPGPLLLLSLSSGVRSSSRQLLPPAQAPPELRPEGEGGRSAAVQFCTAACSLAAASASQKSALLGFDAGRRRPPAKLGDGGGVPGFSMLWAPRRALPRAHRPPVRGVGTPERGGAA